MRYKIYGEHYMIDVIPISDTRFVGKSANDMARDLLRKEHLGPGDTVEAAAYRCQTKYGVDPEITLQGWNRDLAGKDMLTSRWLRLFSAWVDAVYEKERSRHEDTTKIARLADFVAGAGGEKEGTE